MTRKILIIDGHPDPARARLCHALADAYVQGAQAAGKETRLITLADTPVEMLRTAIDFAAPPQDEPIKSAQADIVWADHVVFIFPLWLGGAPALLRAFLEQAARGGFFADTEGRGIRPKFRGKSARLIVTMGMPAFVYRLVFHAHGLRSIMEGVLGFAGFRPVHATLLGGVETVAPSKHKTWLQRARMLGADGR